MDWSTVLKRQQRKIELTNLQCILMVLYERKLCAKENGKVETAAFVCPFLRHHSECFRVVNLLSQKQLKDINFRPPMQWNSPLYGHQFITDIRSLRKVLFVPASKSYIFIPY